MKLRLQQKNFEIQRRHCFIVYQCFLTFAIKIRVEMKCYSFETAGYKGNSPDFNEISIHIKGSSFHRQLKSLHNIDLCNEYNG